MGASARLTEPPPRWLHPTSRSDVCVTWHHDADSVVLTLWRGDECIASAPLDVAGAGDLAAFLVGHLAARAGAVPIAAPLPVVSGGATPSRLRPAVTNALGRLGFVGRGRHAQRRASPGATGG